MPALTRNRAVATPEPAVPHGEGAVRRWVRQHPLPALWAAVLGVGWPVASLPALADHNLLPGPAIPLPAVVLLLTFGVLLPAAVVITGVVEGREGVRRLLGRAVRWRLRPVDWLLVVLVVPGGTVLMGVAAGASVRLGAADIVAALLSSVAALVLIHLAEELVWAGFVQSRLACRSGTLQAALLTAVPFAVMHLPLTLVGPVSGRSVLVDIGGLLVLAAALRALVGVVLERTTGSVLAAAVTHAGFNAANNAGGLADRLLSGVDQGLIAPVAAILVTSVVLLLSRHRADRGAHAAFLHHRDGPVPGRPVMSRRLLPPLITLAVALVGLAVATLLDGGDEESRDTALLVGTAALWGAAVATLWLVSVAGYLTYRRHRAGRS